MQLFFRDFAPRLVKISEDHTMEKTTFFVNRQQYWGQEDSDRMFVEIAVGGSDYANPDMLNPKYSGEAEEYTDPREAVKVAFEIQRKWQLDAPNETINVGYGYTGGATMYFDACTLEDATQWAETRYEKLPKCAHCGGVLGSETWTLECTDDDKYCRQYCAEEAETAYYKDQDELESEMAESETADI
jgi:hypothetical protein